MKAWQFTGTGQPLKRAELPQPQPGPDEVLIAIKAAGLCHTDVGIIDDPGWMTRIGPLPLTLGHEVAGVIVSIGANCSSKLLHTRVGVTPAGRTRPGLGRDGGYSEYCTALPEDLIPVPETVSFAQAAAGTDAGKTAWHAVVCRANVQPGQRIGIIGLGGIGQIALRIAVMRGAEVVVAEPRKALWPWAVDLGAITTVGSMAELEGADFDTVIDFAGTGDTTRQAISAIRREGTVVLVGLASLEVQISSRDLVTKHASLLGSTGGSTDDIAKVYELMARGELTPELPQISFDEIPQGIDQLRRGDVVGRLVAVYE